MKREHWLITGAAIILCFMLMSMFSCTAYTSISFKQPNVIHDTIYLEKVVKKEKPKNRYQEIKEKHNEEWLNLPHRESENELFQPK